MTEDNTLGVLYFGNSWNAENRTSSHHVARLLAEEMPLLYFDCPGMRMPSGNSRDLRRIWNTLRNGLSRPRRIGPNLWHCTLPQLPMRSVPGIGWLNRCFAMWAVRRARRLAGLKRSISWFVVPHTGFLAGNVGDDLAVYYCIDDYASHPGVDCLHIEQCDAALSRDADLVFVAPPSLVETKRALNPNTFYAPHGVDFDHFASAQSKAAARPGTAPEMTGPVVGYIGSIHTWTDLDLIAWLAQQRLGWNFLLVGHAHVDTSHLKHLQNVHFVGPKPYEELPRWAGLFDAAIIPYRQTRQVSNANPLKLREYLASGLKVVSTRNPESEKFGHLVQIADTPEAFLRGLDKALSTPASDGCDTRMAAVADQTWRFRVSNVLERVMETLHNKRTSEQNMSQRGATA